jgi:DNA-cytosine methyltransferase
MKKLNVMSLFNGMSFGMMALETLGVEVGNYYSSEIDKYANQATKALYPDIIQMGDVTRWREWDIDWSSIDLIIGGSPCQGFSSSGKKLSFDDPRSKLYFEFENILNHARKFNKNINFMLENVKLNQIDAEVITKGLGVKPKLINSDKVSAQNRIRYYWASWDFNQPDDKNVILSDIIDSAICSYLKPRGNNSGGIRAKNGKVGTVTSNSWEQNNFLIYKKNKPSKPKKIVNKSSTLTGNGNSGGNHSDMDVLVFNGVEIPLTSSGRIDIHKSNNVRRFTVAECARLQTVPEHHIDTLLNSGVSNTQLYKMLGNGWTHDVIVHIFKGLLWPS